MENQKLPWVKILLFSALGTTLSVLMVLSLAGGRQNGYAKAFVPYENAPTAVVIGQDFPEWKLSPSGALQHDGTQFYVMARSVFDMAGDGSNLDRPHYRWQRPLLAWLTAPGYWVGGPEGLIVAFFVVTTLSVFAGSVASGVLGAKLGNKPVAALVFGILPGSFMSVLIAVADVLSLTLFLWGVILLFNKRFFSGSVFFVLACLAKESTLVLVAGFTMWELLKGSAVAPPSRQKVREVHQMVKMNWRKGFVVAAPSFFAVLAWGVFVRAVVPVPENSTQVIEFTYPLYGYWDSLTYMIQETGFDLFVLFSWVFLTAAATAAFFSHKMSHPFSWALLGSLLLLAVMNLNVIGLSANATRMMMSATILALLMVFTPSSKPREFKEALVKNNESPVGELSERKQ